ncbi:MAG: hypothetical protein R2710_27580 [Acidimicrobiales bacterium]
MMRLLIADTKRFYARRMTLFFPAAIALLMIAGIVIAYFVIENGDSNPDFVNDMAGGVSATAILGPVANLLPVMAFVIGASFIGADLKNGHAQTNPHLGTTTTSDRRLPLRSPPSSMSV